VIDATGRRSPTADWLAALGAPAPVEESEDIGFLYTGCFWRSPDGELPETRAAGLTACGSISLLTIPSDNGTWSTTIYTVAGDTALRAVRRPEVFERVWRSFPDHAQWLDGEPISDIATMSGAVDRSRHFVVDGVPVVTGMLTIADAAACTNPSVGRGMSLGLLHTVVMRDAVRQHLADPAALAIAFHEATVEQLDPWHQATKELDHGRIAEMQAAIDGVPLEPTPEAQIAGALAGATAFDADALRWFLELLTCLTLPMELFARPGVFERVLELAPQVPPPAPYGPDRTQLLELVTR
jgi:2-polyprenyl-6-methoxyphenol hydroxylase-like FAD-dependent oxidoreductase